MPKTHPNPTLLLNLSNPSSTCRAFSQHTSAARILELLEMTEYKFYLHLGGENQFITETLKPIPSWMCWGNTDCQTSQVKEKQTENTGNKPVCGTAPGHTQGVPASGTLLSLPLLRGCCPGEQHCPRPSHRGGCSCSVALPRAGILQTLPARAEGWEPPACSLSEHLLSPSPVLSPAAGRETPPSLSPSPGPRHGGRAWCDTSAWHCPTPEAGAAPAASALALLPRTWN